MHTRDARALPQLQTSFCNRAKVVSKCKPRNMNVSCECWTKRSSTKMYNSISDDIIQCRYCNVSKYMRENVPKFPKHIISKSICVSPKP